jgi:eukaryotic-like serine/threonine-protein kinase
LIAAAAVALAIALLVVGGVALWGAMTSAPATPGPGGSKADPPAASQSAPSGKSKSPATSTVTGGDALVVRCRVAKCGVFISSVPDNDVLFNGNLGLGEERHADEPRMNLVVRDGGAVDVYINGKLQPRGAPGKRKYYTIIKS